MRTQREIQVASQGLGKPSSGKARPEISQGQARHMSWRGMTAPDRGQWGEDEFEDLGKWKCCSYVLGVWHGHAADSVCGKAELSLNPFSVEQGRGRRRGGHFLGNWEQGYSGIDNLLVPTRKLAALCRHTMPLIPPLRTYLFLSGCFLK